MKEISPSKHFVTEVEESISKLQERGEGVRSFQCHYNILQLVVVCILICLFVFYFLYFFKFCAPFCFSLNTHFAFFVTSLAKEVMFLVALVCLSICLFVCEQHYSKSYERIGMKFYGRVLSSTSKN